MECINRSGCKMIFLFSRVKQDPLVWCGPIPRGILGELIKPSDDTEEVVGSAKCFSAIGSPCGYLCHARQLRGSPFAAGTRQVGTCQGYFLLMLCKAS